jgi:hypothetical protein
MPRRPSGVCVLCGSNGPMTDEHSLQKWARKLLGMEGEANIVRGGRVVAHQRRLNVVAPQALCYGCNVEWLGPVEDQFKALMGRAITGQGPVPLDADEQDFVALWAVKSALLLELAMRFTSPGHFCPIPSSALLWLGLHKTPPPRATVWLGATGPHPGEHPRGNYFSNQPVAPADSQLEGNLITFVYGDLLVKTFVVDVPDGPLPPGIDAPDTRVLIQIRPKRRRRVSWPPEFWVPYDGLDDPEFMQWPLPYRPRPMPWQPDEPPEGFE